MIELLFTIYFILTTMLQDKLSISLFYRRGNKVSGKLRTPQGHRDSGDGVRFESQLRLASKSTLFMMTHCFKSLNSQHPA